MDKPTCTTMEVAQGTSSCFDERYTYVLVLNTSALKRLRAPDCPGARRIVLWLKTARTTLPMIYNNTVSTGRKANNERVSHEPSRRSQCPNNEPGHPTRGSDLWGGLGRPFEDRGKLAAVEGPSAIRGTVVDSGDLRRGSQLRH